MTASNEIDLWPEAPAMSYKEANAVGRDRAEQVIDRMRRGDAPNLLGHVLEAMMKRQQFGGVEIGFCHALSVTLMQPDVTEFVEVPAERQFSTRRKQGPLRLVG